MTTHPDGTITASHWGTYRVQTSNGCVTGVKAFENDPEPSPMIEAMPGMLYADCRVAQPMVRKGWLENGHRSDTSARGVEPFVAVQWDTALDLAAAEIDRVRTNTATRRYTPRPAGLAPGHSIPPPRSSNGSSMI